MFAADGQATIAPMGNNHIGMVSHGNDRGLMAEFFIIDEYKPFKSGMEGHAVYEQVEMVRITVPGAKTDIIQKVKFVDDIDGPAHPNRFPNQYKAFKAEQEQVPDGTPLELCKFVPSHQIKMLKAQGVHTAEQLADCPDNILQNLGMGAPKLRELCRTYIGNDDEKTKQVSRALTENIALKDEMAVMRQQMADLNRIMAERMANTGQIYPSTLDANFPAAPLPGEVFEEAPGPEQMKRGPGRPRKEA